MFEVYNTVAILRMWDHKIDKSLGRYNRRLLALTNSRRGSLRELGFVLVFFLVFFLVLCCFWQFGSTPPPFVAMWQPPDDAWPPGRPFLAKSWEQDNL